MIDVHDVLAAFLSAAGMSRQGDVKTVEQAEQYVNRLTDSESPHRAWAVTDTGSLVGLVGVTVDSENLNGWFWYWMNASHRGRRLTRAAATTVANQTLTNGGLYRLELGHRATNPASGAVARAAGFVHEGIEREKFLIGEERVDVLTYGRLRSDAWPTTAPLPLVSH